MKRLPLILLLGSLAMIGALSIDCYLPALPPISREFMVSAAAAQQTLTIYLFAYAFMTLFYGTLSDSFGRRPVILVALVVYLLASVGCALATSFACLMVFRLIQGLCAGAGNVVGRAVVSDLYQGAEAHQVMSFIQLFFGIAPALAPIIGGWLQTAFGWRFIFYFIVAATFIMLVVCLRLLPESLDASQRHPFRFKPVIANYWKVGSDKRFILMSLGNALTFTGMSIYLGAAPAFIYSILHLTARDFGWLFIPLITGMMLGSTISARMSHRFSPQAIIRFSFALMSLSSVINVLYNALFPAKLPWAMIPPFVFNIGMAAAGPAMILLTLNLYPKTRGLASSFMSFIFLTFFAICSGVISPFVFDSALHLAITVLVGCALSWICWRLGAPHYESDGAALPLAAPGEIPFEL